MDKIPFPDKKYDVIVIDPPWKIQKITHKARPNQVSMDYPMMTLDDIKKLPVDTLAKDETICFLWTVQKYLFDAKGVLESWGFNHLITMVWEKTYGISAGMPLFGFRWNGEFVLVGYRNKPTMWPKRKLIPAVFSAPNVRHSQKPDRFYDMVSELGKERIDIFARKQREGWDVWGNEVPSVSSENVDSAPGSVAQPVQMGLPQVLVE